MKLSLKELSTKQFKLTEKERLMAIVTAGIIAIVITVYISSSEVAVEPLALPADNLQKTTVSPTSPVKSVTGLDQQLIAVNPSEQSIRDPFARAPELNDQQSVKNSSVPVIKNNIPNTVPNTPPIMVPRNILPNNNKNNIPQQDFKLTGIVSGGNGALAVIMSGSKSRSYAVNDMIGAYRLTGINANDVVLESATSRVVLHLESFGQK